MTQKSVKRVLGIDPFSCGVGFSVVEVGVGLVDWGLRTTGKPDNRKAVFAVEKLIDRFKPDVLALEDWEAAGARRCERIEILLNLIANGKWEGIRVRLVSLREIRALGPLPDMSTKYGRASFFADQLPELQAFLPPVRKPWMSEDNRMSIFDAVGFALACLPAKGQRASDSATPGEPEEPV
jgi:hypothetical protein